MGFHVESRMATNRPTLTGDSLLYYNSIEAGIAGSHAYLTIIVHGIIYRSASIDIIYSAFSTKDGGVIAASDLLSTLSYTIIGSSQSSTNSSVNQGGADGGERMLISIPLSFNVTTISISLNASRNFVLGDGNMVISGGLTIPIIEHPGNTFLFITQNNTFLRLPLCNTTTKGSVFFIKNTTPSVITIVPHRTQPLTPIESSSYSLNSYPQLRLQGYQCVGLLCDGTQWLVFVFYRGNGIGQSRNGYSPTTTTEVLADDITSDIIYSNISAKDLLINLPPASSRQMLMIVAERTSSMYGYQLQINQPAFGHAIDNTISQLNLNINSNRNGNCAVFLISDGSTWYIASVFDMTDMDNYGTATLTTTTPVSAAIGINTSGAVTPNVWSGRSYDTMAVAPFALSDSTGVFRIFKENNSAFSNGIGLASLDRAGLLFTNTYGGPNYDNSNTQMFVYGQSTLMAMFGLEIKHPGAVNRIYFLGQYPTRY